MIIRLWDIFKNDFHNKILVSKKFPNSIFLLMGQQSFTRHIINGFFELLKKHDPPNLTVQGVPQYEKGRKVFFILQII
jgi:hypothetical protein